MSNTLTSEVQKDTRHLPLILEPGVTSIPEFATWYIKNRDEIDQKLLHAGAIYFKGVGIGSMNEFTGLMQEIEGQANAYLDGNSPRKKHNDDVYNASEYDQKAKIHLHTEYSYSYEWPEKLFFCCTHPGDSGGETTLADCRKVLNRLDEDLVDEFEKKQIRYIRNLHSGSGFGPSWQEAFETVDRSFLVSHCAKNGIDVEWISDEVVRLTQVRPAVKTHEVTKERLWFNQVDQFYPEIYDKETYETLLMISNNDKEALPMYATFGDGTEISLPAIEQIIEALEAEEIRPKWHAGDLMVVENMLSLHGRMPFVGNREVYVFMK